MSAELLREAAALMRERAEPSSPSPWHADDNRVWDCDNDLVVESVVSIPDADVDHIASWHPAVALAVADWLAREADDAERWAAQTRAPFAVVANKDALAVARAYLGRGA